MPHNVWYAMKKNKRVFVSVYFEDGSKNGRKKRDLTIAFDKDSSLYKECKKLKSAKIKDIIGIYSYKELTEKAEAVDRPLSNFIKYKLKRELGVSD
jgi:hypothetical protein